MSSNKLKSRLRLTNLGKWLVFLALFLLFSAQNTGNNLLYLICSCIITALCFALTNILFSGRSIDAEIIYPKIVNVGQSFDIVCKLLKNDILTRYYMRFEDSWIESLKRGSSGFFRIPAASSASSDDCISASDAFGNRYAQISSVVWIPFRMIAVFSIP